jgi:hypothetical protein
VHWEGYFDASRKFHDSGVQVDQGEMVEDVLVKTANFMRVQDD